MRILTKKDLTLGQRENDSLVCKWYKKSLSQEFVTSGPAGTGKTTAAIYTIPRLNLEPHEILPLAYTGQAAANLMSKGFRNARTIHSALKKLVDVPYIVDGQPVRRNGRVIKVQRFIDRDYIDPKIKLIVVDEWGMLNDDLRRTILKHGIPVWLLGDEFQLPPIYGKSPYAQMINYRLTEIMRQAADNGIIQLATMLRNKEYPEWYMNFNNQAFVMPRSFLKDRYINEADVIITTTNDARNYFNDKKRLMLGNYGDMPMMNDVLICRKNYRNHTLNGIPLCNGTRGKVANPIRRFECDIKKSMYCMDFEPELEIHKDKDYTTYEALQCDLDYFNQPCGAKEIDKYNNFIKMEPGFAITGYLSQGAEWDNVLYARDIMGSRDFMFQHDYTVVTRARQIVRMLI